MNQTKLPTKNKVVIGIILAACLILGIGVSYYLSTVAQTANKYIPADPKKIPLAAAVSLLSVKNSYQKSEVVTVKVQLDTGGQNVEAADFVLNYDTAFFKAGQIKTGTFFKNYPVKTVKPGSVQVSGVAFFDNKTIIVPKGKGLVAEVTFTALKTGSTKISFDRTKTIVASAGKNILNPTKITDLALTIK